MKTLSKLLSLALIFAVFSCQDPTKNVVVHISPDFYDYAISIQLRDIENPNQVLSRKPSFELLGADASEIYAIDGSRNYRFNNGEVALMLNRLVLAPQEGKPVIFTMVIEEDGYRPKHYTIKVDPYEYYSEELIYLVPDDPNVEGLIGQNTTATTNPDGSLSQELLFDFATSFGDQPARFDIVLDSGLTFYNRQGDLINGTELEVDLLGIDTYSDNSTLSLPGSSLVQQLEINGQSAQSFISPMPRLDINLRLDGEEVKSIGMGKMHTRIDVPKVTNPKTLRTYKPGDTVDLISYDELEGFWRVLEQAVVKKDSIGKYLETDLDNFSTKSFTSTPENQVPVHIKIVGSGQQVLYTDVRASFAGNEKLLSRSANRQFDLKLDPGLVLYAQANPEVVYLECETGNGMFSSLKDPSTGQAISVKWSSGSDTLTATLQKSSDVFVGYYTAYCVDQPQVLLYPPVGTKVFIKEAGEAEYGLAPVHVVTPENKNNLRFETSSVEDGKSYDIKITYSGEDVAERLAVPAVYGDTIQVEIPSKDCDALGI